MQGSLNPLRVILAFSLLLALLAACDSSRAPTPMPTITGVASAIPSTSTPTAAQNDPELNTNAQVSKAQGYVIHRGDYARTGDYSPHVSNGPSTNDLRWTTEDFCNNPPEVYERVVYLACGNFLALDLFTGDELWRIDDINATGSATFVGGLLYLGTINRQDDIPYRSIISIVSIDHSKQAVVKEFATEGDNISGLIVLDDSIFFIQYGNLYAIDADTGIQKWRFAASGFLSSEMDYMSPAADLGLIYYSTTGEVIKGHEIYPDGHLYAVDMRTGKESWSYPTIDGSAPVVNEEAGLVYVETEGMLVALDAANGQEKWKVQNASGPPALRDDVLYVALDDKSGGALAGVNSTTGEELWLIDLNHDITAPPSLAGNIVYYGNSYGNGTSTIYALDLTTLTPRWNFKTADNLPYPPVIADGSALIGGNFTLYAVGASPPGSSPTLTP